MCFIKGSLMKSDTDKALCQSHTELLLFLTLNQRMSENCLSIKATDIFFTQLLKPVTEGIHIQHSPK